MNRKGSGAVARVLSGSAQLGSVTSRANKVDPDSQPVWWQHPMIEMEGALRPRCE